MLLSRSLATTTAARAGAEAAAPAAAAPVDPKLSSIVDQIEKLTLLEASELVTALKVGHACVGYIADSRSKSTDTRNNRLD